MTTMSTLSSHRHLKRGIALLVVGAISLKAGAAFGELLFSANFNSDVVGAAPDLSLPGPPPGDFLAIRESSGTVRVRTAVGTLVNKPVEMNQVPGIGAVDLLGWLPEGSDCESVVVSWRSLARSNNVCYLACVLRSSNLGIIAALQYRDNGRLDYLGVGDLPVTYTADVDQLFEITIDFVARTTSLSVDGVALAGFQGVPFVNPSSTVGDLRRIGFEAGCITTQDFAVDDIKAESPCGAVPVEENTWGAIKALYQW